MVAHHVSVMIVTLTHACCSMHYSCSVHGGGSKHGQTEYIKVLGADDGMHTHNRVAML